MLVGLPRGVPDPRSRAVRKRDDHVVVAWHVPHHVHLPRSRARKRCHAAARPDKRPLCEPGTRRARVDDRLADVHKVRCNSSSSKSVWSASPARRPYRARPAGTRQARARAGRGPGRAACVPDEPRRKPLGPAPGAASRSPQAAPSHAPSGSCSSARPRAGAQGTHPPRRAGRGGHGHSWRACLARYRRRVHSSPCSRTTCAVAHIRRGQPRRRALARDGQGPKPCAACAQRRQSCVRTCPSLWGATLCSDRCQGDPRRRHDTLLQAGAGRQRACMTLPATLSDDGQKNCTCAVCRASTVRSPWFGLG
jgi:hypothetical protein